MKFVLEEEIKSDLKPLLEPEGFFEKKKDTPFERWILFEKIVNQFVYSFDVCFLYNSKQLYRIESYATLYFSAFEEQIKRIEEPRSFDPNEPSTATSMDLGQFINPENSDRIWISRNNFPIKLHQDSTPQDIVDELYFRYFSEGMLKFIDETNSLEKLDSILNSWATQSDDFPRVTYCIMTNQQILLSLIVAVLTNNPNVDRLINRYTLHMSQYVNDDIPLIHDIFKYIHLIQE